MSYGGITLDGNLSDWSGAWLLYDDGAGHRIYGRAYGGGYVFAATGAGDGTTFWLNTDQNAATGFQNGGPPVPPYIPPAHPPFGYVPPPPLFGDNAYQAFAGGAEFAVELGGGGSTLTVPSQHLNFPFGIPTAWSGDTVEFVVAADIIAAAALNFRVDFNNTLFVSNVFTLAQPQIIGGIGLDGALEDWSAANLLAIPTPTTPQPGQNPPGSELYAKSADGSFLFALKATDLSGAHILIDADQNAATGYTVMGSVNESLVKIPGNVYTLATGIDFQVSFDSAGVPWLYTGAGDLVGALTYGKAGDVTEIAVSQALIGGGSAARVMLDFYNGAYGVPYVPPSFTVAQTVGGQLLDGSLSDWNAAERLDTWQTGLVGYEIYGKAVGDSYVIALKAPMAIGQNTTAWINTDANMNTGYKIWGFAGGAEYFVNFDAAGNPQLFAADGVPTLLATNLLHGFNADHTVVEFAIPKALLGNAKELNTLYDINDTVFLPTTYLNGQYKIADAWAAPVITSNGGGDSSNITLAENIAAVTTVTATDILVGPLNYAIIAGADALSFAIDANTGVLSFKAAPDFENATDSDHNNVYDVVVSAVDSTGRSDQQLIHVSVTDVKSLTLNGSSRADTLTGGSENDALSGAGGNDTLRGGDGRDTLTGGAGYDTLTGGAGGDLFVFKSIDDISDGTRGSRDVITDFVSGQDRIDLSAIDANSSARGDQAFVLLTTPGAAFTAAGQLHVVYAIVNGVEHTYLEGNVNSNLAADFRLDLIGHYVPNAADFVL